MASIGKGARNKGKRFELAVAKAIRRKKLDPDAKRMPRSGGFVHFPEDIYTTLPIHIECKCREQVSLWKWWEETTSRAHIGNAPILVISGNYRPTVAVVDLDYLLDLLKTEQDYLNGE